MKIAITAALASIITLIGAGTLFFLGHRSQAVPATAVRVEAPVRGDLVEIVSAPGVVEPKTKVSISARVSARITELPFREGQAVTKGNPEAQPPAPASVLVRLDDNDLRAALRSAQAQHDSQAAQLEVAKSRLLTQGETIHGTRTLLDDAQRDLERKQTLHKSDIVAQTQVDEAQCLVERRQADLAAAENSLKADRINLHVLESNLRAAAEEVNRCQESLSYTEITSPINGIVTRIKAQVGELVVTGTMNNPGTEILQVADLSKMLVVAQADEGDIGEVRVGQRAKVTIRTYHDRRFDGTVDSIALVQTPGQGMRAGYFEVKILLATEDRVLCGLSADVEIESRRHSAILKVPSQAILSRRVDELPPDLRDGNPNVATGKTETPVVYRCIDGKATVTPVKIDAADATHTVVVAGLNDGDKVVVGPYKVLEHLANGQRICDDRKVSASRPATQPSTCSASGPATSTPGAVK